MNTKTNTSIVVALLCTLTACATDYPVPKPRPVKTDIRVGTYIFPGYYRLDQSTNSEERHTIDAECEWDIIVPFSEPRPVLGFYDDSLPEVNDWHIKWALEAGISFFVFDWYWMKGETRLMRTLEDGFLKSKYCGQMDFCINWCNHPLDYADEMTFTPEALEEMFEYCATNYFSKPNYLKVKGRPVFMVWNLGNVVKQCGGVENFKEVVVPELNKICRKHGGKDLYLIYINNEPQGLEGTAVCDAVTHYGWPADTTETPFAQPGSAPYSELVDILPGFWEKMQCQDMPYWVSTQSGWDDLGRTEGHGKMTRWVRTGNTVEIFERSLVEGKAAVKPELPFFIIEAWNEWGEGSYIEPSRNRGFVHLDAIRRTFAPQAGKNEWAQPTPEQIRSYSVYGDEKLAIAKANEAKPYPEPPAPAKWPLDIEVAAPSRPKNVIKQFLFSDPKMANRFSEINDTKILGFSKSGMKLTATGEDPKFVISGDWGPIEKIKGFRVTMKYSGSKWNHAFFLWGIDQAEIVGKESRRLLLKTDGEEYTYTMNFREGYDHGDGNLTAVRLSIPSACNGVCELIAIEIIGDPSK
ncbi:MAG: glycoside hydrolase family 99-like domain-containing protein [Verrucomicrobiota bacterium]